MDAQIVSVANGSIAQELGLVPGDRLVAINERNDWEDLFDYESEVTNEAEVLLEIVHADGQHELIEIEKDYGDDLGLTFASPIFTPIKTCNNACPFCFIDQQPEGLRPSLYVKDDDYRLSYFCSTYITLTNLTRHDRERIERIRPGPFYVSVHSTVPEVRQQLLQNTKAGGNIMTELRWLASLEIPFHAQLVICPGINDGESLTQTLSDLSTLRPHCLSVALVPLGLTQHRINLPNLQPMTQPVAEAVLARLSQFEAETGMTEFAFASDEFYIRAQQPMPGYEAYGDFPQLDDGVGSTRILTQAFFDLEATLPQSISPERKHLVVTGKLGAMILQPIVQRLNQIDGLYLDLVSVDNVFWGESVTVSGLITGQDILRTLKTQDCTGYTSMIIPATMIKQDEDLFLDGVTLSDMAQQLGCPVQVVPEPTQAESFLNTLFPNQQLSLA